MKDELIAVVPESIALGDQHAVQQEIATCRTYDKEGLIFNGHRLPWKEAERLWDGKAKAVPAGRHGRSYIARISTTR
jgi:hypothetical protein